MEIKISFNEADLKSDANVISKIAKILDESFSSNTEIKPEVLEAKPVRELEGDRLEPCIVGGVTDGFTHIVKSTAVEIPDVPQLTVSDIQKIATDGALKHGTEVMRGIVQKLGVASLSVLPQSQYGQFKTLVEQLG